MIIWHRIISPYIFPYVWQHLVIPSFVLDFARPAYGDTRGLMSYRSSQKAGNTCICTTSHLITQSAYLTLGPRRFWTHSEKVRHDRPHTSHLTYLTLQQPQLTTLHAHTLMAPTYLYVDTLYSNTRLYMHNNFLLMTDQLTIIISTQIFNNTWCSWRHIYMVHNNQSDCSGH